ncbi:MAG: alpha/beta fold hydrolase [Marinomonas sp.]
MANLRSIIFAGVIMCHWSKPSSAVFLSALLACTSFLAPFESISAQSDRSTEAKRETTKESAARFGLRSNVLDISLSPSGTKIAIIGAGPGHSEVLKIIDLEGAAAVTPVLSNTEKIGDLDWCEWATDTRLVCQMVGMGKAPGNLLIPFDRLFAVDADGKNASQLSQKRTFRAMGFNQFGGDIVALDVAGDEGNVLLTKNFVPENSMGTRLASDKEGMGVELVDIETGKSRSKVRPDKGATRYVADQNGRVRLKVRVLYNSTGRLTGKSIYLFRSKGSDSWNQLEEIEIEGKPVRDFSLVSVDSVRDVAFGFVTRDGYDALIEVTLGKAPQGKFLLNRDDVDVDRVIRIGRQRRVVGASYATEKRTVAYFDDELNKLAKGLGRALPDTPIINIVGASADENRLLIIGSSDTQPGMVYLFDKVKSSLEPIVPVRDYLVDWPMGSMKPVNYPASDGTQIPGYLTLPPGSDGKGLPAIVLPHGGPASRDVWGFDWLVQFFTARGYAVLQPNYRGSSGYGEAWYGRNGYKSWDVAIGDVNDAGRWLISQGIAMPDKLAIVGWSYGGYAALQSQVVDPDLYKAVVAIAPVTDLEYLREDARQYTFSSLRDQQLGRGDHIAAGSPRRHANEFKSPVALFHGNLDLNVRSRHSAAMERALKAAGKQVSYTEFDEMQHGLQDSKVRTQMLTEIDLFLNGALGKSE